MFGFFFCILPVHFCPRRLGGLVLFEFHLTNCRIFCSYAVIRVLLNLFFCFSLVLLLLSYSPDVSLRSWFFFYIPWYILVYLWVENLTQDFPLEYHKVLFIFLCCGHRCVTRRTVYNLIQCSFVFL